MYVFPRRVPKLLSYIVLSLFKAYVPPDKLKVEANVEEKPEYKYTSIIIVRNSRQTHAHDHQYCDWQQTQTPLLTWNHTFFKSTTWKNDAFQQHCTNTVCLQVSQKIYQVNPLLVWNIRHSNDPNTSEAPRWFYSIGWCWVIGGWWRGGGCMYERQDKQTYRMSRDVEKWINWLMRWSLVNNWYNSTTMCSLLHLSSALCKGSMSCSDELPII